MAAVEDALCAETTNPFCLARSACFPFGARCTKRETSRFLQKTPNQKVLHKRAHRSLAAKETPNSSAWVLVECFRWDRNGNELKNRSCLEYVPEKNPFFCSSKVKIIKAKKKLMSFISFCFDSALLKALKSLPLNILALGKNSLYMTAKGYARKLLVENFIQFPTNSAL